jgi:hypothetical protein
MLHVDERKLDRSWLDETSTRFERSNDALVLQTRSLLNRIVADAALHARFVNMLSMLEHLGCHKIMATQHGAGIDQATLKHVAEEAHHAFFMKRQAEKEAQRALEYVAADLLAPAAARMYFRRLEASMVRVLHEQRSARAAYLYMSMVVEFRALWLYRLYEQTLKRAGHTLSLKRVLGEEQAHLKDMAHRLELAGELSDARMNAFLERERGLYERLLGALLGAASAAM